VDLGRPQPAESLAMAAAAMETERASPLTIGHCRGFRDGTRSPSTSSRSGTNPRPSSARCMARWVARRMLMRSISVWSASPSEQHCAFSRIRAAIRSRCFSVRRLESSTPVVSKPSPSTTAQATTGPQRAPRPTSSRPATTAWPSERAFSSKCQVQWISAPLNTRGRRPRVPSAEPPVRPVPLVSGDMGLPRASRNVGSEVVRYAVVPVRLSFMRPALPFSSRR
jgi:hypothetical protein